MKRVLLLMVSVYTVWTFGSFAAYVVGLDPLIGPVAAAIGAVGFLLGPHDRASSAPVAIPSADSRHSERPPGGRSF